MYISEGQFDELIYFRLCTYLRFGYAFVCLIMAHKRAETCSVLKGIKCYVQWYCTYITEMPQPNGTNLVKIINPFTGLTF